MKRWLASALGLVPALLAWPALGEPRTDGVTIEPVPGWVDPLSTEGVVLPPPTYGVAVIAVDYQTRAFKQDRTSFARSLVKVMTEAGARSVGEQKLPFMPPYQRLALHTIEVRRAGKSFSHLDMKNVRVVEREEKLHQNVYDGGRTAVVIIPDVRVGDEVLTEQSLIGENPVLAGHFAAALPLGYANGVGRVRHRLWVDEDVSFRKFGEAPDPAVERSGDGTSYRWWVDETRPVVAENDVPAEHDVVPWVQVADTQSWAGIAGWGRGLFSLPGTSSPALEALVDEVRVSRNTVEGRVLLALRLVQDRVRYLALAFAESSHRPAAPDVVLGRGYGDCKDKSLLLLGILRALEVPAEIALVHSRDGARLPALVPTTGAFDHAVVTLTLDGVRYVLDPARLYQRGSLADVSARGYRYALRLADGVKDLTELVEPPDIRPDVQAHQLYRITRFNGPVSLTLTTTFIGPRADEVRGVVAAGSTSALSNLLTTWVRRIYPKVVVLGDPVVKDEAESNQFTAAQDFSLEGDWTSRDGQPAVYVFPLWLAGQLPTAAPDRKGPVALFPLRHIAHTLEVLAPDLVASAPTSRTVANAWFKLHLDAAGEKGKLVYRYDFKTLAPRVEIPSLPAYRLAVAHGMQLLDLAIVGPKVLSPASRSGLFLLVGVWTLLCLGGVLWVFRREPYLERPGVRFDPKLRGFDAALTLLGFGVVASPIRLIVALVQAAPAYSATSWTALTTEGSAVYHAAWEPFLTVDLLAMVAAILGSLLGVYLFWKRHRSFPLVFGFTLAVGSFLTGFDFCIIRGFDLPVAETVKDAINFNLVPALISCAWLVYLLESKRVKARFLPAPEEEAPRSGSAPDSAPETSPLKTD